MNNQPKLPVCKTCNSKLSLKIMKIFDGKCWKEKCHAAMKVAIMYSSNGYIKGASHPDPDLFNDEDIEFARLKGVLLKSQHSQTAEETYLANTCGSCNAFIGGYHLFTDYFCLAEDNTYQSTDFEVGYHCENCFNDGEDKAYKEKYGDE